MSQQRAINKRNKKLSNLKNGKWKPGKKDHTLLFAKALRDSKRFSMRIVLEQFLSSFKVAII